MPRLLVPTPARLEMAKVIPLVLLNGKFPPSIFSLISDHPAAFPIRLFVKAAAVKATMSSNAPQEVVPTQATSILPSPSAS